MNNIDKIKEIIPSVTPEQAMAINNLIVKANNEGYDLGYDTGLEAGKLSTNCGGCKGSCSE